MIRVDFDLVDVDFPETSEKAVFISSLPINEVNIAYLKEILEITKDIFDIVDFNEIDSDDYVNTFYEELKERNILNLTYEKVESIIDEFCIGSRTTQSFVKVVYIISGIRLIKDDTIISFKVTV